MSEQLYTYIIVGGGLAGASAVQGIRERDKNESMLLIGGEEHLPYDRPPLSKKLWFGKKKVEEIFVHDQEFYDQNGVELALNTRVMSLDANQKMVTDDKGKSYRYEKLLLATGGTPRPLSIPGGDVEGLYYYRYLNDYLRMRGEAAAGKSAVVIGGGFIGSEMAAALNVNGLEVTMVFPESYLVQRVFPEYLGQVVQQQYLERGVKILTVDVPTSLTRKGSTFITQTKNGRQIESDLVVVGIGIVPTIELAEGAGLETGNGIVVNEYLQTSHQDIYARYRR